MSEKQVKWWRLSFLIGECVAVIGALVLPNDQKAASWAFAVWCHLHRNEE